MATCYEIPASIPREWSSVPIGSPIANTRVYLVDERLSQVSVGEPGELCIGGDGLASGYFGRPDLTAERFMPDPFSENANDRIYRTGDMARWTESGTIEFLGRRDDQVKLNGNRIELGEVKSALLSHPAVLEALVNVQEVAGQRRLVAYYTLKDASLPATDLDAFLRTTLPATMVPSYLIAIDKFPTTPNGKIDQKSLPSPLQAGEDREGESSCHAEAQEGLEAGIVAIWKELLQIHDVPVTVPFFSLGGTSLLALRMVARIKSSMGVAVPIAEVFKNTTVRSLAEYIADRGGKADRAVRLRDGIPVGENPVAVIGMAVRLPGADNVGEFWEMLREGKDGVRRFRRDELDPSLDPSLVDDPDYVKARGVLRDPEYFDAEYFGIVPREAEEMDTQQRVFLELVVEALEDAGCDPHRYPGAIGVFAGSSNTTYWFNNLMRRPDIVKRAGDIALRLSNEKDFLVTRAAYLLGLRGPALSINTACSTSLVAIAQAFHSLRAGECDVAVAGGVTITCPPNSGNLYQEGAMFSPDGATRAFDAEARGTTFSDGAAVVVLKRLSKAVEDGDCIYSVLRGVGLNNDGSDKMSFVAPSVTGQADAIRRALEMAGVSAEKISYVEAHGTATPIGDPIEVAALTSAFRMFTSKSGFCGLGSAKSNVGHTVSAAGAVGFIKASLALKYRVLPATAHFVSPNPQLQLEGSPFWVVGATQPWVRTEGPLMAGVSSFGFGGTNAHAILEEAPELPPLPDEKGVQLLVLSAKKNAALERMCANLSDFLARRSDLSLADVAFTLQTGRASLECRAYVTASGIDEAVEGLKVAATAARLRNKKNRLVFLFPGQGSQYVGMGSRLYETSAAFRDAFSECAMPIGSMIGEDLREVISSSPEKLTRTKYTQPALFAVMYALARHWESLGIKAEAAIGHSVGEFAAACLAGVMRPEDAARLVAIRGALVDSCPPGRMMAVRMGAEELAGLLPQNVEIAARNAPASQVVSGQSADLEAFEKILAERGVPCRLLNTSHAFHSRMMDEVVEKFRSEVAKVKLFAPRFPIVSTLTGAWMRAEDALDPAYWGRHLRHPVLFREATEVLLDDRDWAFLEVGPQSTLTKLLLQNPKARGRSVVASLSDLPDSEDRSVADALGCLWQAGFEPDWTAVHGGKGRRKLPLPTYPFQRKKYWVEPASTSGSASAVGATSDANAASPHFSPNDGFVVSLENQERKVEPIMAQSRKPLLLQALNGILENLSGQAVSPDDAGRSFAELGLDSLQLTQAALSASKTFGVKLKLRQFVEEYQSPSAMVDYLDTQVPADLFAPTATAPTSAASAAASAAMDACAAQAYPTVIAPQAPASGIQALIGQQIEIMRQQLALLSGGTIQFANAEPAKAQLAPAAMGQAQSATAQTIPAATTNEAAKADASATAGDGSEQAPPFKPHGPQLVIDKIGKKELTPTQEKCRRRIMDRYQEKTGKSKEFTQRNRARIADPRAVGGFKPQMKEMIYPIVVERSSGCHLWDLDGNRYVDMLSGFGSNFFGFGAPFVKEAIARQMDVGMEIGPSPRLIEDLSNLFHEFVPMDRIAFCNTGSEAVLATFRMARTATGKDTIVMFHGSYHGMFDEVVVRAGGKGRAVPAAPGIPAQAVGNVLMLDWASDSALDEIRKRADQIAAVITEPVQSRMPEIQPAEFLRKLRRLTEEEGIALIFDEVVTGFRIGPGGAQEHFGIRADMATYGKVIGGGVPIGIVAGKKEYMDCLDGGSWQYGDASVPEVGVTYFAGTFVRHPIPLAATVAVLKKLKNDGPELYRDLNERSNRFVQELRDLFEAERAPITIHNFGSLIKFNPSHDVPFYELLFVLLRLRGVHCWDGRPCFMTLAHTREDLDFVVRAFRESIAELQEGGFYPTPVRQARSEEPPVPGAKLGRDKAGMPKWFIPDPKDPAKIVEVE